MITKLAAASIPLIPLAVAGSVPEPNAVVLWLLGLAGASVIFNQVAQAYKTLTHNLKEQPPPSQTYATKADCHEKHRKAEAQDAARDGRHEAQITAIHNRINQVLAAVSRLEGKVG